MEVAINGHQGFFYLHPELDYTMGDPAGGSRPVYSHADLVIEFPSNYLKEGDNSLSLQPVTTSQQAVPDAAVNYDALELDAIDGKFDAQTATVDITPTIFYQKADSGLTELVDVFVRYGTSRRRAAFPSISTANTTSSR